MTSVHAPDAAALRRAFAGELVTPADPGYDTARAVWNGAVDHRPALLARCTGPEDVAAALDFARARGLEVSVRGGGHQTAGAAVCPDGLVLDLTRLDAVRVDPEARTVRCGGGTTLAALDAATQAYGLAVPSGTVSHTGVGGLTLGGGIGWLTEEYGLSCDNLLAAETVLADGRVLRAAADQHPELFWALRGGGGNFGVVTEFTFRLHPVGPEVQLGLFFWDLADGDAVLRRLRETVPELPPGTGVFTGIGLAAPPMALVPPEHRGRPGHTLLVAGFDGPEAHARALAPLAEGPPALVERRAPIPYRYLQRLLDDHAPYGILAHDRALPLPVLDDAVLELLGAQLPRRSSPLTFCPSFRLDGAYIAVPEEDTAFGGARRPCWVMNISALALEPRRLRADAAWAAALWTELLPYAANPGGYVNFLAQGEQDRVRASYGPKYARLAAAKARYDPGNVFHRNANILPEPGRGAGGAPSPPD